MRRRAEGVQAAAQLEWNSLSLAEQEAKTKEVGRSIKPTLIGPVAKYCVNNLCTIRIACALFKEFIDIPEGERDNPELVGHYWQSENNHPDCDQWVLHPSLNTAGQGTHIKQFQPKTNRVRRRGGKWSHG